MCVNPVCSQLVSCKHGSLFGVTAGRKEVSPAALCAHLSLAFGAWLCSSPRKPGRVILRHS